VTQYELNKNSIVEVQMQTTLAEKIHNGATSAELGITEEEYAARQKLISQFLLENEWNAAAHVLWLLSQKNLVILGGEYPDSHIWENKTPTVATMATGLVQDAGKIVSSGMKFATEEDYKKRIEICNACEAVQDGRCLKCGCYMSIKAKFTAMRCPINLW